jgi:hypothetical protein
MKPSQSDQLILLILLSLVFVIVFLFNSLFVPGNPVSLENPDTMYGLSGGSILVFIVPYIAGTFLLSLKSRKE